MTIFLVASGCALALNYKTFSSLDQVKRFYVGRLVRIYPAYWIAIVMTILLFLAFIPGYARTLSIASIFWTFSGLYVFLDQWGGPIMGIGWFIGLILALYLLYPLIVYMFNKNLKGTLILLLVVSLLSRIVCGQLQSVGIGARLIDWMPLCRVFEFGLGIYMIKAGFYIKTISVPASVSRILVFASNLSFAVFLIHFSFYQNRELYNAFHIESLYLKLIYIVGSIVAFTILALIIYYIDGRIQKILKPKSISNIRKTTQIDN